MATDTQIEMDLPPGYRPGWERAYGEGNQMIERPVGIPAGVTSGQGGFRPMADFTVVRPTAMTQAVAPLSPFQRENAMAAMTGGFYRPSRGALPDVKTWARGLRAEGGVTQSYAPGERAVARAGIARDVQAAQLEQAMAGMTPEERAEEAQFSRDKALYGQRGAEQRAQQRAITGRTAMGIESREKITGEQIAARKDIAANYNDVRTKLAAMADATKRDLSADQIAARHEDVLASLGAAKENLIAQGLIPGTEPYLTAQKDKLAAGIAVARARNDMAGEMELYKTQLRIEEDFRKGVTASQIKQFQTPTAPTGELPKPPTSGGISPKPKPDVVTARLETARQIVSRYTPDEAKKMNDLWKSSGGTQGWSDSKYKDYQIAEEMVKVAESEKKKALAEEARRRMGIEG